MKTYFGIVMKTYFVLSKMGKSLKIQYFLISYREYLIVILDWTEFQLTVGVERSWTVTCLSFVLLWLNNSQHYLKYSFCKLKDRSQINEKRIFMELINQRTEYYLIFVILQSCSSYFTLLLSFLYDSRHYSLYLSFRPWSFWKLFKTPSERISPL